jgi:hypothetical protein
MSDTVDALVLDLLEWIGPRPRPYGEVLDAWRTSCPRLPFGRPLRSVVSSPASQRRKAVPALRFPPPGQSTCASIAAAFPTATLKPLRRPVQ